jgi:uncharacterized protein DUF3551
MAAVKYPRVRRLRYARPAIAAVVLAGTAAFATPSFAQAAWRQAAPWCANMGGGYGFDCSYRTFDQCMATARGLGNFCTPNPRAQYYAEDRSRRRVRTRKRTDD